jgi:hypothetical protein
MMKNPANKLPERNIRNLGLKEPKLEKKKVEPNVPKGK